MLAYVVRRLLALVVILVGIGLISFLAIHATPGDPVDEILANNANREAAENMRRQLGLTQPLPVQYARWMGGVLHGDFGRSLLTNVPVTDEIMERFPSTVELAVAGLAVSLAIGVPLGLLAAVTRRRWVDSAIMVVALGGLSVPSFWLGLLLLLLFGVKLGWFPVLGGEGLRSLVLPAFTLGIVGASVLARLTRSSMLEVLRHDYVQTARAKGLAERAVIVRHAFRNALIPVITVIGIQFGHLLAGTVIIEAVFARPGVGSLAIRAIQARDFPLVQGIVLFYAALYVLTNLVVDLLYGVLDPRIRLAS
ncbi:MAG TPA: nickel ABC transporter permease [Thermomicrobiales bacterium]|nr:nickel ABC transporter permease [Thermomicrobiales bacterium]